MKFATFVGNIMIVNHLSQHCLLEIIRAFQRKQNCALIFFTIIILIDKKQENAVRKNNNFFIEYMRR